MMTTPDKALRLEMVAKASAAFEAARKALQRAVHVALDHGATWADIGGVLGVSRQAAFQRFGPRHTARDKRAIARAHKTGLLGETADQPTKRRGRKPSPD